MKPETLIELLGLKELERAGWVRHGIAQPESVAAHSWGVAWLVLVLLPPHLDRERALAYAVLHDLPEVRVGDLTPADGVPPLEKVTRERVAAQSLLSDRPDLLALWESYEAQDDPEARFVHELDRLDMALQAVRYSSSRGPVLTEFLDSAARAIHTPELRRLMDQLRGLLAGRCGDRE